jgi:serine phosphatase RsbU (regulator of sigma subunit)
MFWKNLRPLAITAFLLSLVIPVLCIGGFSVQNLISDSFQAESAASDARTMLFSLLLSDQLDEETGIRGYAATRQKLFLEPFRTANARMNTDFDRLARMFRELQLTPALQILDDASTTNEKWQRTVATPILKSETFNPLLQQAGKVLVDQFRQDINRVDEILQARQLDLSEKAQSSISRISVLIVGSIFLIAVLALSLGGSQGRYFRRLDEERRVSEEMRLLYETEKKVGNMLQEAFVQKPLPKLSGVSFSATYVPASESAKVGGDWYEGVELSEARVLFAIGDVAGHGLPAAVSMNRARQALLSAAMLNPDPATLLTRVNEELLQQHATMVTALCGYADSQIYQFTYATAGHPPPILLEPGQPPRFLLYGGLPLSMVRNAEYRTHTVQTVPGAMLVLYTDGLLEHSRDVLEGETLLLEAVVQSMREKASEPAVAIRDVIFRKRTVGDDVAILTIAFIASVVAQDTLLGENESIKEKRTSLLTGGAMPAIPHFVYDACNPYENARRLAS